MKPRFSLLMSGALAICAAASAADPGHLVFVGDSITQGGTWAGAGTQASYRYSFFKNMVDQGLTYRPMGIGEGSSTKAGAQVGQLAYRGRNFENVHEAAASARSYTWSGIPSTNTGYNNNPATRANEAPVWNLLGLTNPQTGTTNTFYNAGAEQTYTGPTYSSKYGETLPDTVCLMIGINDLIAVKNGTQVAREDNTTSAYTYQDVIANTKAIVDAYQQYNPDVEVVVMGLLPTAPNNGTYNMSDDYNALLQEAVQSWSTDTSTVRYAEVSQGLSITDQNHYDNGGAHPNSQGELIIAGNLAQALGVGQRTLGLQSKAVASFTNRLDSSSLSQTSFSLTGTQGAAGSEWNTFADTTTGVRGLTLHAGVSSEACLTATANTGWNVSAAEGFTLQASIQMYSVEGNSLFLQFGDGVIGDGQLRITTSGVYWGIGNTLLFEGGQTDMNDYRITYMPTGNTQGVDAGYYVWLNNQLIGEALAASASKTDALTVGSANGSLTYAGIADVSWENGAWAPADSTSISASMQTAVLPEMPSNLTGDAVVFNNSGTNLNSASVWGNDATLPGASDTIRFDTTYNQPSVSLSSELAVRGAQFETSSTVEITSASAGAALNIGEGGITLSETGSHAVVQRIKLSAAQTWDIGADKCLRVGTSARANQGSLTADWTTTDHTVTIRGGGSAILDTASGALQAIDWKVTGGSTLKALWNTVGTTNLGGLGSGVVTLDDGTLGVNYGAEGGGANSAGNWSWGNDIAVGDGNGTIKQFATSGDNRWLNLSGSISLADGASSSATLTFSRENTSLTVSDRFGFILSGDNSAFTGKIVVDASTWLRVGAAATNGDLSTRAGTLGTLHTGILENNGVLTLTRTDAWEVAATMTGDGIINVGSTSTDAVMSTASQRVTLSGNNGGFTGAININQGTLVLGNANALGASSGVSVKANGTLDLNGHYLASNVALSFTSGGKITNTSDTASKISLAATGISSNIWTNATIEAAAGKTIQLEVSGNHASFNGKLSGSGTIEKTVSGAANQRHMVIRSSGNEFDGKLIVSQGWLILSATNNAQTFAANYRPDLEIAAGACFTVGDAYTSEESALKLGNVTGSGNFTADYGNGMHYIDVQIDQSGGATFDGVFQLGTSSNRNYSVIKRGGETWTLTGAHAATGFLKAAEGDLHLQGTWVGSAVVDANAVMTVSGAVGSTGSGLTHTVNQGGVMKLTGSGEVRNNGAVVSVKSGTTEAGLGNVTVSSTSIARTSADGEIGVISNANIRIDQTNAFAIEHVRLDDSVVDLASAGSVTLDNVLIGSGSSLQASGSGTFTVRNSSLELSSANLATTAGIAPVGLTRALGATVEGSLTLTFTRELIEAIGAWEGGPYNSVRLTLTDVLSWGEDVTIQFAGGETLYCDPSVENITVDIPSDMTGGTVTIDVNFGRPIPESASATLGLFGFLSLLVRRRRRG